MDRFRVYSYGYRGKDCRDNLFRLPSSGELVYNMAGVVVLYDHVNSKQRHYTEHTDDVKRYNSHYYLSHYFVYDK